MLFLNKTQEIDIFQVITVYYRFNYSEIVSQNNLPAVISFSFSFFADK